jgi:mannosylglucosylglycerate synthase
MTTVNNRIGFVSTRFAGTDGVSLETEKLANILHKLNYECFYFAGELDTPKECSYLVSEAHFNHPEIKQLTHELFEKYVRPPEVSERVHQLTDFLKMHLYRFIEQYQINLLIVQNALSIPMNVPLGMAITKIVAETRIPTIAHHHDFAWERTRFAVNAAEDYLRTAFPPTMPRIRHLVINSFAARQLALRTGTSSITLIPNVMDFDQPPPEPDGYADDLRDALGIGDDYFLLQPTRIVPRKRIEHAIDLIRLLKLKASLVISHSAGDEGMEYQSYLEEYARTMGVRVIFAADFFAPTRSMVNGRKIYSLADAYQQADLVTYPSAVEGFGNAFLETIYYKKPIVISTYEIFKTDILPKGFQVIRFEDFVSQEAVLQTRQVLEHPELVQSMVERNYELGRRYYSYRILEQRLAALLNEALGSD